MNKETKENLTSNIVSGLPGAAAKFSLKDVKLHLKSYENITERS